MKLEWKDISSWGRSDVDRTPKTWVAQLGEFRAVITRRHGLAGWYVEFADLFGYKSLKAGEIEEAKREATLLIYTALQDALQDIRPEPAKYNGDPQT